MRRKGHNYSDTPLHTCERCGLNQVSPSYAEANTPQTGAASRVEARQQTAAPKKHDAARQAPEHPRSQMGLNPVGAIITIHFNEKL